MRYALFIILYLILSLQPVAAQLAPITRPTVNNVMNTQTLGTGRPVTGTFSPDGKLFGLVGSFGAQVYELSAPDIPDTLGGDAFPAAGLAFSPDSSRAVVSAGYSLRLYDLESASDPLILYPDNATGPFSRVAYHPNGTQFAVGTFSSTGRILIYDAATLEIINTLDNFTSSVTSLEYNADGGILAAGSNDSTVTLYETEANYTVSVQLVGHTSFVTDVAFDLSRPTTIYTSSVDGLIQAHSLPDGTFLNTVYTAPGKSPNPIHSLMSHPDGSLYFGEEVLSADGLTTTSLVNILNPDTGVSTPLTTTAHRTPITALSLSPSQSTLLSVSADFANLLTLESQNDFSIPFMDSAYAVAVTSDGNGIAIGGSLDLGSLFGSDGTLYANFQTDESPIRTLAYSPNGGALIAGTDAAKVYIFGGDGQRLNVLENPPGALTAAQFSPDNSLAALGFSDGTLQLYNTSDLSLNAEMILHGGAIESLDFNTDGTSLMTGSLNSLILIWEVPSLRVIGGLTGHTAGVSSVEFSPDGTRAVTGSYDGNAYVWDLATQTQMFGLLEHYGGVTAARYSPDATLILTTCEDTSERLYDAVTGEQLQVFYDHNAPIYDGAWLTDGTGFVTVGGNGFGLLFEVVR